MNKGHAEHLQLKTDEVVTGGLIKRLVLPAHSYEETEGGQGRVRRSSEAVNEWLPLSAGTKAMKTGCSMVEKPKGGGSKFFFFFFVFFGFLNSKSFRQK